MDPVGTEDFHLHNEDAGYIRNYRFQTLKHYSKLSREHQLIYERCLIFLPSDTEAKKVR